VQPTPPRNPVDTKWSTRLTPLEPYLRIGLSGHGLPRLPNPALFYQGLFIEDVESHEAVTTRSTIHSCPILIFSTIAHSLSPKLRYFCQMRSDLLFIRAELNDLHQRSGHCAFEDRVLQCRASIIRLYSFVKRNEM
jgi:hypothetical protein